MNDTTEEDPDNSDQVSRSHSLGDLTSGLTLSLTGQKKADSMLNLSQFPNNVRKLNHTASSSVGTRHQKDHRTNVRTNEIKTPKTERTGFQGHSQGRQEYNFQGHEPGHFQGRAPGHFQGHTQDHSQGHQEGNVQGNLKAHGQGQVQCQGRSSQQSVGSDQGRSSVSSSMSNGKTKRSLPRVPVSEQTERIKRFTELMRARMALHSSSGQSTSSQSLHTPLESGKSSLVPESCSSYEVSELLQGSQLYQQGESEKHTLSRYVSENSGKNQRSKTEYKQNNQNIYLTSNANSLTNQNSHSHPAANGTLSRHHTGPPPERRSDSGQTTLTSHSHSSTMDSGYATNDCESDLCSSSTQTNSALQRAGHQLIKPHFHPNHSNADGAYYHKNSQPTHQDKTRMCNSHEQSRNTRNYQSLNNKIKTCEERGRELSADSSSKSLHNQFRPIIENNPANQVYQTVPQCDSTRKVIGEYPKETSSTANQNSRSNGNQYHQNEAQDSVRSDIQRKNSGYHDYERSENRNPMGYRRNQYQSLDNLYELNNQGKQPTTSKQGASRHVAELQNGYQAHAPQHRNIVPQLQKAASEASVRKTGNRRASEPIRNTSNWKNSGDVGFQQSLNNSFNSESNADNCEQFADEVRGVSHRMRDHFVSSKHMTLQLDSKSGSEFNRFSTLPGGFKFQTNLDEAPKSPPVKNPTLHQLAQLYTFHPIKIDLSRSPANENGCCSPPMEERQPSQGLTLADIAIKLPGFQEAAQKDCGTVSTPQGNYARLGGPGSAFRPVRNPGNNTAKVISIQEVSEEIQTKCMMGNLMAGDLLVEVCY